MTQLNLVDSFKEFKEFKNIDHEVMMGILEDVFRAMILKTYGDDSNFDIIINPDKGDLEIWRNRDIVADDVVEDENQQVSFRKRCASRMTLRWVKNFLRKSSWNRLDDEMSCRCVKILAGRIMELEKDSIYRSTRSGLERLSLQRLQIWKREILLVDDEDNEVVMPRENQIPGDFFKKGDTVRAVVSAVEMKNNNPRIVLSRTAPNFWSVCLSRRFRRFLTG